LATLPKTIHKLTCRSLKKQLIQPVHYGGKANVVYFSVLSRNVLVAFWWHAYLQRKLRCTPSVFNQITMLLCRKKDHHEISAGGPFGSRCGVACFTLSRNTAQSQTPTLRLVAQPVVQAV